MSAGEALSTGNWLGRYPKHLFIVTSAGKPVFAYHEDGDETMLAITAMMRALAFKVNDKLEMVSGANGFRLIFLKKDDLFLVSSQFRPKDVPEDCFVEEHEEYARGQLEMLYQHILMHITKPVLNATLSRNAGYDISSLLGGPKELRNLVEFGESHLNVVFNAVPSLPISVFERKRLIIELENCRKGLADAALLVSKNGSLIAGLGRSSRSLVPLPFSAQDLTLLANLLESNARWKTEQIWVPLCMPGFDSGAQFQVYLATITDDMFLFLFMNDRSDEMFKEASNRRDIMRENLKDVITAKNFCSRIIRPVDLVDGPTEALHLAIRVPAPYGWKTAMFIETNAVSEDAPLDLFSPVQRRYVIKRYANARLRLTEQGKLSYEGRQRDICVFYRTNDFELFGLFPPLTEHDHIVDTLARLKVQVLEHSNELFVKLH